ncbi:hypothetical protein [Paenibacillus agricola]|uniref:hypothetical protein n=1 Tax=Paenibacillus agricola TaxID=2716264 RepID=UPI001A9ED3A5|nr:hypothetical protein [Paenibacillus agricola]
MKMTTSFMFSARYPFNPKPFISSPNLSEFSSLANLFDRGALVPSQDGLPLLTVWQDDRK